MDHTTASLARHIARHVKSFPASPVLAFANACLAGAIRAEGEGRPKDATRILRDGYLELVRVENDENDF